MLSVEYLYNKCCPFTLKFKTQLTKNMEFYIEFYVSILNVFVCKILFVCNFTIKKWKKKKMQKKKEIINELMNDKNLMNEQK